jgi:hypothetical protein
LGKGVELKSGIVLAEKSNNRKIVNINPLHRLVAKRWQ